MKNFKMFGDLGVLVIVSIITVIAFAEPAKAGSKVFRVSTQMPPKHHTVKALEIFKDQVEKQTEGEISIKIHPSGQLFKGRELPMAVGSGAVEMGDIVTPYLSGIFPELELLDAPFLIDSREMAEKVFSGEIGSMLDDKFKKLGMKLIFGHPYGFFSMYGTNVRQIKKPEDMKGLKIRAVGQVQVLKAKAAGAIPETIPGSEQYMAYKRGVVDIGQTGPSSFVSRSLYDIFKYGTIVRDDLMIFHCVMNLKEWDKLSQEEKKIIEEAGRKAADWDWEITLTKEKEADEILKTKMELYIPSGDELEIWKKVFKPVSKVVAENAGKRGLELYDALKNLK